MRQSGVWWALLMFAATTGCGRVDFDALARDAGGSASLGPACPSDTRLLACFDFDNQTNDQTGRGNDATATSASYVTGLMGTIGLQMDATSRADIATPNLASAQYTIDVWIDPAGAGAGTVRNVFDHDSHWAMDLDADGKLECWSGSNAYSTTSIVANDRWTHVACTFDGNSIRGYIDGQVQLFVAAPMYSGDNGTAAVGGDSPFPPGGFPWIGTLDRMRLWNTALSSAELLVAAGQ